MITVQEKNRLKQVAPILRHYSVEANFVEDFGRVQKIYSNKGIFALKKIKTNHGADFIRHVHNLYQKGYNRVVPIYPTADGRYAVLHDHHLYYLMPWLANELKEDRTQRYQQMFRELARMHTLSVREVKITKEEREEHYENTLQQWEKEKEFLSGFIEQCEKRAYMSPTELLFCLYYHDITQAIKYAEDKLKAWYEKTKEEEKARTVLIHGKVSPEHFLFDERGYGYFLNFENAKLSSPLHDMLPFLSRSLKTYPKRSEEAVDWFYTYLKYFPYKEDELLLFQSYFAYPGPVIRAAERYYKKKNSRGERKMLQYFQNQFWLLKNTEYVIMRIEETERQKQEAAAAAAAQAQAEQEGAQN